MGVNISEQEAKQMFSAIDVDSKICIEFIVFRKTKKTKMNSFIENGRIEFEEFAEVVADSYFRKFSRAEILESFRRFDRNHDGFIEAEELKNILSQLGRNFSTEEVRIEKKKKFNLQLNLLLLALDSSNDRRN